MTPTQRLTVELLKALEKMVDAFDAQGATSQATQLSAVLDEYHAEIEEIEWKQKRRRSCGR